MKLWGTTLALASSLALTAVAVSQDVSAVPPPPSEFAAPATDPAGRVAREIAAIVRFLPNLRAHARLGQWRLDERARWSVRSEHECLQELASLGVDAEPFTTHLTPIPTPVRVVSDIGGVRYRKRRSAAVFIVSCELAVRLSHLSTVLREYGVNTIDVTSSWRRQPHTSFHRMGLAIDVHSFHGARGTWIVERDYPAPDPRRPTCPVPDDAPPLRRLACDIAATGRFSTMITPDYSAGHRDHFHIDVRPDDPRVFVR